MARFLNYYYLIVILTISKSLFAQEFMGYPPPGKLFDAGGHLLHLNIQGKGSPVVIFENGSGDFSFIWSLVQPEIAKFTACVSYDRAGFAWSEPGPSPRSSRQIAFELHEALQSAGLKAPYILVGQSFGGFLVRAFARIYPNEIAGMVLVDVLHENSRIVINNKPERIREMSRGLIAPEPRIAKGPDSLVALQKQFPVKMDSNIEFPLDKLPKRIQEWQIWAQSNPVYQNAASNEMNWSPDDVQDLYNNRNNPKYKLGNIPLIVLSKGSGGYTGMTDSANLESERLLLQADLAKLSTNGKHIIVKNSGHNIHLENPSIVIASIKQVYKAAKYHTNLAQSDILPGQER